MIRSIPFKPGHLDLLNISKVHSNEGSVVENYDQNKVGFNYAETIIDDELGIVLGVMSGILIHEKCFEVCMVVGDEAKKRPVGFTKHVKKALTFYADELDVSRVQTMIRCDHEYLVKWMSVLGFEYEATLKRFGLTGDDYMLYVRFRS